LKKVMIMDLINYHSEVLFGVVPAVSYNTYRVNFFKTKQKNNFKNIW